MAQYLQSSSEFSYQHQQTFHGAQQAASNYYSGLICNLGSFITSDVKTFSFLEELRCEIKSWHGDWRN